MAEKPTYEELEQRIRKLEKENSAFKRSGDMLEKHIASLSRPLTDDGNIVFEDLFNINDIQHLQDEFAKATGVASIIIHTNGTPITAPSNFCRLCKDIIRKTDKGLANCYKSDAMIGRLLSGGPIIQPCLSCGLLDAGAGIFAGGRHIANWLVGQVRDESHSEDKMAAYAREIGASEKAAVEAFREVPVMSREQFEQIARVLYILANQLSTTAYQNVQQARFISERKHTEQLIKESEERFRYLSDASMEAIFFSKKGFCLEANQVATKIFGYDDRSEFIGMFVTDLVAPESRSIVKSNILNDTFDPYEAIGMRKNGTRFPISIRAKAMPYKDEGDVRVASISDITDIKRAEETLRKGEREYQSTIDGLLVGVVVHDADTRILISNQEASNILGLTAGQLFGKEAIDPAWMFVHEDSSPMKVADYPVNKVISIKSPLKNYVLGIIRPDRAYVTWVNVNASPLLFADGKLEKVIVNFMDITERKQAEKAIEKSESFQRKMVANIGDVIVIIDQDGINRYKSPNIEKLFGWKPEDIVGTCAWDNVHPEDLESLQNVFGTLLLEPNAVETTEGRYQCKDGSYRWIEFTGTNLLHDSDIRGILGNYHDITERKLVEQSLIESEARFKALHNASFGGIAIHDKGIILDCNRGLSEMTGYSAAELIGMDGLLLIAEESRNTVMNNIVSGYEKPYEAIGLRKNGEEFPVRLEARNIPYKGKNVRAVEFRDLTERKQADAERKKLMAQLAQSQKMESIGTLAGGIAHDFNNILYPILGYTEMLLEDIPKENPLRSDINEIYAGAMRASDLVKQILTFSRRNNVEVKIIKIQRVIKEALTLIRSTIPTSIDIEQDISNNCGVIKADPTQIHQVVMNLATNAYHAMIGTSGKLKVSLKEIELGEQDVISPKMAPGVYACLIVADTGVGMNKDLIEKIFDPFFSTKETDKGTGMGLAVVHGIVHSAGGIIQVYSEPGKGTAFHVYLPVVMNASEQQEQQTKKAIPRGTEQILIVDDEKAVVSTEKRLLERLGYQVVSCINSAGALEIFRANPDKFDLVITDMAMPNMSGDKLAEKIKKIRRNIPVILITGFSDKINIRTGPDLQIDGFLMKPVDRATLAKTIRKLLDDAIRSD